jgi:hypothetical protein
MISILIAASLAHGGASPPATPGTDVARIERSPSTNTVGWSIAVGRDGKATVVSGGGFRAVTLQQPLATKLYADLERAAFLAELPSGHCMKSASFGTTTIIAYRGQRTPDLQCALDAPGQALNADAEAIAASVLGQVPRAVRHTMPIHRALLPQPTKTL